MADLAPNTLMKLLKGMETGTRATSSHRTSVLQVTDIVPAGLDQKSLLPKQGFLIKLSDSTHSAYVSLPPEHDDFVLSDKLRLGQLVSVDRLDPGSPLPVLRGAHPLPSRRPIADPQCLIGPNSTNATNSTSNDVSVPHRRGSWGDNSFGVDSSDVFSTPLLRRSCAVASFGSSGRFPRSRSVCERAVPISPFNLSGKKSSTPPPRMRNSRVATSLNMAALESRTSSNPPPIISKPLDTNTNKTDNNSNISSLSMNLPGKLSTLGKEAVQQRDTAQKIALQALREASATDTLVRSLKMFSNLTKNAKPENPTSCFEQFLEFHGQISQAISDMVSIRSAQEPNSTNSVSSLYVLSEIGPNTPDFSASKRRINNNNNQIERSEEKKKILRSSSSTAKKRLGSGEGDENAKPCSSSSLATGIPATIRLGRQIERECGNWFMEFVEKALLLMVKKRFDESLMGRLVSWVENEHCGDCNKRSSVHPKASQIARKLRIKMKNP